MIDENLLSTAMNATGESKEHCIAALNSCTCTHIDAMNVFLSVGRFPSPPECVVINTHGFEYWQKQKKANAVSHIGFLITK